MTDIPYFTISNEQLRTSPNIGKTTACPKCGKKHRVQTSTSVQTPFSNSPFAQHPQKTSLHYIVCKKAQKTVLVGIDGKEFQRDS